MPEAVFLSLPEKLWKELTSHVVHLLSHTTGMLLKHSICPRVTGTKPLVYIPDYVLASPLWKERFINFLSLVRLGRRETTLPPYTAPTRGPACFHDVLAFRMTEGRYSTACPPRLGLLRAAHRVTSVVFFCDKSLFLSFFHLLSPSLSPSNISLISLHIFFVIFSSDSP